MNTVQNQFKGYRLFDKELKALPKLEKMTINTINQYSFCIAEKDKEFKRALMESDILLPDGIGIVVALRTTTGQVIEKISGSDLHFYLLENLNKSSGKCFYMGSSLSTLTKIKERLAKDYPNIECHFHSPPFKPVFSSEENKEILDSINTVKPDVVFVGMTAPKQEKWVNENRSAIDVPIVCSIGAVFDFYAGVIARPSPFWINLGLEWFVRLCKEPKRMWKRYVLYGPIFVYALVKEKLKTDFSSNIIPKDCI